MTNCPECEATVAPKDMIEGEIFSCPDCGSELEVTARLPFSVVPAPRVAEDWGE
jgi:alpha-aminoadipate/glutamate carrier protein LysW